MSRGFQVKRPDSSVSSATQQHDLGQGHLVKSLLGPLASWVSRQAAGRCGTERCGCWSQEVRVPTRGIRLTVIPNLTGSLPEMQSVSTVPLLAQLTSAASSLSSLSSAPTRYLSRPFCQRGGGFSCNVNSKTQPSPPAALTGESQT